VALVWLLQLNSDLTAIEGMSHSRVDFSALARERIAAAQAAIAAAEKLAMNAYKAGSFHADTLPALDERRWRQYMQGQTMHKQQ
jgi:hypothetical protein